MANMTIPFISMETAIQVDIYNKIAMDISNMLGVSAKTVRVLYNSMEVAKTDIRSNAKRQLNDVNTPTTNAKARFTVNINDDFNDEMIASELVNKRDHFPIFRDTDIGVSIAPVYINTDITFEFTYVSTSKIEVDNIRDRLRMIKARNNTIYDHDVEYSMIIPVEVTDFIEDVHRNKSRLFPIGLKEYMTQYTDNRVHLLTDMSNDINKRYAVKEHVFGINGEFDFTSIPPRRDTDSDRNVHRLKFNYMITMDMPRAITISYPIMVCNQLLPDKYLLPIEDRANKYRDSRDHGMPYSTRSATVMHNLTTSRIQARMYDSPYPINIPNYDEYRDYQILPGYSTILTLLISVNEVDRKSLFNLHELGDYYLSDYALEYIKRHKSLVTQHCSGLLFMGLDQHGKHMSNDIIEIDDDLNVRSVEELDLMRPIRITLSVCTDLNYLTDEGLSSIIDNVDIFASYLKIYLELRDSVESNVDYESRDKKTVNTIVTKIFELYSERDFESIRTLITIIETDTRLYMQVGYMFVMSFPSLLDKLVSRGIAFIDSSGGICLLSKDPMIKKKQLIEYHDLSKRTRGGYSGIRPTTRKYTDIDTGVSWGPFPIETGNVELEPNIRGDIGTETIDENRTKPPIKPIIQKTVQLYNIITYRRE